MIEYETWYHEQVEAGKLPDKDGYWHYSAKEICPEWLKELFHNADSTD